MPSVEKIEKSLKEHGIEVALISKMIPIMVQIPSKTKKQERAAEIIQVINNLDSILENETKIEVMDWCGCCKGGQRDKDCKNYAKTSKGLPLNERIQGLSGIQYIGIARPRLNEDGTITAGVYWEADGIYKCPCPNFNDVKLSEPVSLTYCYCCVGHFRHHLQNALQRQLKIKEIRSTALNSIGGKPCEFIFEII